MSEFVKPFAALRPTARFAADVIAPPYDVVSTDEARDLARDRPSSFLHVSRPEIDLADGSDPHSDAAYAKARENFDGLRERGVLVRDDAPAYYVYRMRMGEHEQTGIALTASVRAYRAHRVRRHELTRPDKENDRVRHIEALDAQTGPVLCAYRATGSIDAIIDAAAAAEPLMSVPGPNDVVHTIWRVDDAAQAAELDGALNGLDALYIADGHHRSAAAARVAESRQGGDGMQSASDYFLCVAFAHDRMNIYDYNRVAADLNGLDRSVFLDRIAEAFELMPSNEPVRPAHPREFGLYVAGRWYRLAIHPDLVPSDPVGRLDVSLLQRHLIERVLDIRDPRTDPRIDFVGGIRGLGELERRVDARRSGAAFSLYPTSMTELMAVADAEKLMPPKSTWFEPKLADGLLSHLLR